MKFHSDCQVIGLFASAINSLELVATGLKEALRRRLTQDRYYQIWSFSFLLVAFCCCQMPCWPFLLASFDPILADCISTLLAASSDGHFPATAAFYETVKEHYYFFLIGAQAGHVYIFLMVFFDHKEKIIIQLEGFCQPTKQWNKQKVIVGFVSGRWITVKFQLNP